MSTLKSLLVMSPDVVAENFGYDITHEVMDGSGVAQSVTEVRLMLLVANPDESDEAKVKDVLVFDVPLDLLSKINKDSVDGLDLLVEAARRGLLPDHPFLNLVGPKLVAAAQAADEEEAFEKALREAIRQEKTTVEGIAERLSLATGKGYKPLGRIELIASPFGLTLMFNMIDTSIAAELNGELDAHGVKGVIDKLLAGRNLPADIERRMRELLTSMLSQPDSDS